MLTLSTPIKPKSQLITSAGDTSNFPAFRHMTIDREKMTIRYHFSVATISKDEKINEMQLDKVTKQQWHKFWNDFENYLKQYPDFYQKFMIPEFIKKIEFPTESEALYWITRKNERVPVTRKDWVIALDKSKLDQHFGVNYFKVMYLVDLLSYGLRTVDAKDAKTCGIPVNSSIHSQLETLLTTVSDQCLGHLALLRLTGEFGKSTCSYFRIRCELPKFENIFERIPAEACQQVELNFGLLSRFYKKPLLIFIRKVSAMPGVGLRFFTKDAEDKNKRVFDLQTLTNFTRESAETFSSILAIFEAQHNAPQLNQLLVAASNNKDVENSLISFIAYLICLQPTENILTMLGLLTKQTLDNLVSFINQESTGNNKDAINLILRAMRGKLGTVSSTLLPNLNTFYKALIGKLPNDEAKKASHSDVSIHHVLNNAFNSYGIVAMRKELTEIMVQYCFTPKPFESIISAGYGLLTPTSWFDDLATYVSGRTLYDTTTTLISPMLYTPVSFEGAGYVGVLYDYREQDSRRRVEYSFPPRIQGFFLEASREEVMLQPYTGNTVRIGNPAPTTIKALWVAPNDSKALECAKRMRIKIYDFWKSTASTSATSSATSGSAANASSASVDSKAVPKSSFIDLCIFSYNPIAREIIILDGGEDTFKTHMTSAVDSKKLI